MAEETVVVDGMGQRLSLRIENVRGGGGQRQITLSCPFWIVNTTEHVLTYKQENSKTFVSGTVYSSTRNRAVSSREFQVASFPLERRTMPVDSRPSIFAGTPGALADTDPGRCSAVSSDVAQLIDKDLPFERLASLAFMFNFQDESSLGIGNQHRLCIQLRDGDRHSDWSKGLNLDSSGTSSVISYVKDFGVQM